MRRRKHTVSAIVAVAFAVFGTTAALGCREAQASQERIDLYDAQSRRTGYAIVDRQTGRVDLYDAQSRRLGYGVSRPSGSGLDFYRANGQRWLGVRPAPGLRSEPSRRGARH